MALWYAPEDTPPGAGVMITDSEGCDLPKREAEATIGFYDAEGYAIGYIRLPFDDLESGRVKIT